MMKTSRSERKNKVEMVRREKKTVLNKGYHLGSNGANIYMVVEFNGRYTVHDSCPDKKWRCSDEALVSGVMNRPSI
jgi:hypothetical protein